MRNFNLASFRSREQSCTPATATIQQDQAAEPPEWQNKDNRTFLATIPASPPVLHTSPSYQRREGYSA